MVEVENCSVHWICQMMWSESQGCDFADRSTASKLKLIMTTIIMIIIWLASTLKLLKLKYLFKF